MRVNREPHPQVHDFLEALAASPEFRRRAVEDLTPIGVTPRERGMSEGAKSNAPGLDSRGVAKIRSVPGRLVPAGGTSETPHQD